MKYTQCTLNDRHVDIEIRNVLNTHVSSTESTSSTIVSMEILTTPWSEMPAKIFSTSTIVIIILAISSMISYTVIIVHCVKSSRRRKGIAGKASVRMIYVPKISSNTTTTAHQRRFVPPRYLRNRESNLWKNNTDPGPSNQPQPNVSLVRSLERLEKRENSAEDSGGEENPLFQEISSSNPKRGTDEHRPIANFSAQSCESLDHIDTEEINVPQSVVRCNFSKGGHSLKTRKSINSGKDKQEHRPVADFSAQITDDIHYVDMEGTGKKIPSEDGYINLNYLQSNEHHYMNRSNENLLDDDESLPVYGNCMVKQLPK